MGNEWREMCAEHKGKRQAPVEQETPKYRKKGGHKKPFAVEYRPMDDAKDEVFAWESWEPNEWRVWNRYKKQKDAEQAIKQMAKSWCWSRYNFRLRDEK
jgi:hypothetical protein